MFPSTTQILIADDTELMRSLLKYYLNDLGFTNILEAGDGEEAFTVLSKQEEIGKPVQLVLSDWQMPKMDGFELLKLMRSLENMTPFILITTLSEAKQVVAAIKAGASNYIVKPFTKETLVEKLAVVWAKHKPTG